MANLINNKTTKLVDVLKERLKDAEEIDIATAYFYFSGFDLIAEDLKDKKVRILIGMILDPSTNALLDLCRDYKVNQNVSLSHYSLRGYSSLPKNLKQKKYEDGFVNLVNRSSLSPCFDYSRNKKNLDIFFSKMLDGSLEIKLNGGEDDHSKYYILKYKDKSDTTLIEDDTPKGTVIMGSSNFTFGGLAGNGELNEEITSYDDFKYDEYLQMFEENWNSEFAVDVCVNSNGNNLKFIDDVKPNLSVYSHPDPFYIYLRVLFEYYSSSSNDNEIKTPNQLSHTRYANFKYQLDAIKYGIKCIENNNGVIIADVVGLGKSIIACTIAKNMDFDNVIIICPPHLVDQWQQYISEFSLPGARAYSSGKLDSLYHELLNKKYDGSQRTLFIIDEAHRYRNEQSISYGWLHQITRLNPNSKVMLLTATPYNNHPQDIFSLIKLFQTPSRSTISTIDNLDVEFHRLITRYNTLAREGKKGESEEARRELSSLGEQLRILIDPVVIRRSRIDLQKIDVYREDLELQNIKFPEVIGPELIEYDLGDIQEIYIETLKMITEQFLCTRYNQTSHLIDSDKFLEDYGDLFAEKDITVSQKNLAEFIKRLLVMRFESSKVAFKETLTHIINSYEVMVKWWDKGYVPISLRGGSQIDDPSDVSEDEIDECLELNDDLDALNNQNVRGNKKYHLFEKNLFDDSYIEGINSDLELLKKINDMWFTSGQLGDDPKYKKIAQKIKELNSEYPERKIVVFSSYSDTAKYVRDNLAKDGFRVLMYTGQSSESERKKVKQNFDASYDEDVQKDDYDVLVATDAISEGFNLNRAGVVINYDIPYNPTRVIQRIGRINRINKKMFDRLYIYNCFPTEVGEENILVKGISTLKMLLIQSVVGSDTRTLTPDETLTSYFKRQYDEANQEENEESWDIEFRNAYEKYKDNTEVMDVAKNLPIRTRILRKGQSENKAVTYVKRGERQLFVTLDDDGKPLVVPPETAFALFKADQNEKGFELDERFDNDIKAFNDFIDRPETRVKNDITKNRALDNLKFMKALCPGESNYLSDLIMTIEKYDDLSDGELRDISRLVSNNEIEANKNILILKEKIPVQYINSINIRVEQIDSEVETIMFTEELEK